MHVRLTRLLVLLAFTAFTSVWAEEIETIPDSAPPPPQMTESGDAMEPEVTIILKEDSRVEEYRLNGRLYLIKIIPVVGPAYFLLDDDGDGVMETNMSEIYQDFTIPQWVLFSW